VSWSSQWYANKHDFSELLVEDTKIRRYIKKNTPALARQDSDRTHAGKVVVFIHSSRVGRSSGKKGEKIDKLRRSLETSPPAHRNQDAGSEPARNGAAAVAQDIAEQLEKRVSFRRTIKNAIQKAMENGAKGIRVQLSGRLGGAENGPVRKGHAGQHPACPRSGPRWNTGFHERPPPRGTLGLKSG